MKKLVLLAFASVGLAAACSSSSPPSEDVGPSTPDTDSGTSVDATAPSADSGSKPSPDASGSPVDAGKPDSSVPVDAGKPDSSVPVDAGKPDSSAPVDAGKPDSSVPVDAGTPDSGSPVDAGRPDSSVPVDAGTPDSGSPVDAGTTDSSLPGDGGTPSTGGFTVGKEGVAAFALVSSGDQTALKAAHVWFTHASVGGNIVSGASAVNFPFASVWSKSELAAHGLSETYDLGSFNTEPLKKITSFQNRMIQDDFGSAATIAGMKFCYIDFNTSTNLSTLQTAYSTAITTIRARFPTVRLFHVTPPLVPATAGDVAVNTTRVTMGDWMKTTYGGGDVVFDLEDVESTDATGTACLSSGRKVLCNAYNQDDAGHLNDTGAQRAAKAFLYALHLARKGAP